MLGRVVMLEDQEHGGVTSKTYLNVTLRMYTIGCYGGGQAGALAKTSLGEPQCIETR